MKPAILVLMACCAGFSQPQGRSEAVFRKNSPAVFGGMGIHRVFAPDITEYINAVTTHAEQVGDGTTAVDFFGGVEFPVGAEWGLKVEHAMMFTSYSVPGKFGGTYDVYYAIQSPSVLIQRVIVGKGYFFKIGGGGGYHFGTVLQKVSTFGVETEYRSSGIGFKAEAVGQTAFGDDVYGYINGTIDMKFLGEVKDNRGLSLSAPSGSAVSLQMFSAGLRFGIIYYI